MAKSLDMPDGTRPLEVFLALGVFARLDGGRIVAQCKRAIAVEADLARGWQHRIIRLASV